MAKDYAKGAAVAGKDFPKNRLASRGLEHLAKNAFGLVPGYEARRDEFIDGYRDTHRAKAQDAQRIVQTSAVPTANGLSHPPISLGASTMSYGNSNQYSGSGVLSHSAQSQLLSELRAYLLRFETGLNQAGTDYRQKIAHLEGMLMQEDHQGFEQNHLEPALRLIMQLRQLIMDESVPALERAIQYYDDHPRI